MPNSIQRLLPILALTVAVTAEAADWPQWRGPHRDGISQETGLLAEWPEQGPPMVWRVENAGYGFSTPAVVDNVLYLLGNEGESEEYVAAISGADGSELWRQNIGNVGHVEQNPSYPGARSTPTVVGDVLYVLGSDGDLVCMEIADGKIRWQKNVRTDFGGEYGEWAYSESPLIDGDKLICAPGGTDATVVALNRETGELIWKTPVSGSEKAAYASAVMTEVDGVKQYVLFLSGGLVGVEADSGKLLWQYNKVAEGSMANIPTPVAVSNWVYGGSSRGGAALLQLVNEGSDIEAQEVYFSPRLPTAIGGYVLVENHLYGSTRAGMICVDFKSGDVVWQDRSIGSCSVCYADGNLYLKGDKDEVALIKADPSAYTELGRFTLPEQPERKNAQSWTYPVISNGKLYLRDLNVLWCYDIQGN